MMVENEPSSRDGSRNAIDKLEGGGGGGVKHIRDILNNRVNRSVRST